MPDSEQSLNVFDEPLASCSEEPLTGYFRDGCCNTSDSDAGSHTICVELSPAFLEGSRARGNDLITPRPELGFPGLKPGDRWCVCASRWLQAQKLGFAPRVFLASTHRRALEIVPMDVLLAHAADLH